MLTCDKCKKIISEDQQFNSYFEHLWTYFEHLWNTDALGRWNFPQLCKKCRKKYLKQLQKTTIEFMKK